MVPVQQPGRVEERGLLGVRDLVYVTFRRRWVVLAVWLPIIAFGVLGLYRQTGAFVASSTVMLELSEPSAPQNRGTVRSDEYDRAISTYANLGMSVPVAQRAASILADSLDVLVSIDPGYARLREDNEAMFEFILDNLSISRVAESNLMTIQSSSPYARASLMVNRAVRDAFLNYTANTARRAEAVVYYEEQLSQIRATIDSLLAEREAIALATGLADPLTDGRNTLQLQTSLQAQRFELESQIAYQESQLDNLRAVIAGNADFVPTDVSGSNLVGQRARLDDALAELTRLRTVHPEESPPVQRQMEQVVALRKTFRRSLGDYVDAREIELNSMRTQLAEVNAQLAEVEQDARKLPNVRRRLTLIDAQVNAKTKFMRDLQGKLGDVVLSAQADERVNRLLAVTEPEIVTVISPLRRYLYMGLLAVAGLVLGLLVALLVDRSDNRIYNVTSLGEAVDAPVLGAVSLDRK
jgi:uncharacterized protein involved in exopolysaccharide biosynthesis